MYLTTDLPIKIPIQFYSINVQKNSYGSKMADTREVRIEEQLKIKIGEAKNLCSRNNGTGGTAGLRDVYCTVALDQEEICRTPTIERTLNPFYGEEFQFQIPRRFRYLSLYVWDRDRHLKQDKPIGKIAIRREELHKYNHKDHWFSLRPVDADSEVQGMAHVQISFDNGNDDTNSRNASNIGDGGNHGEFKENDNVCHRGEMSCGGITSSTLSKNKNIFGPADLNNWSSLTKKSTILNNIDVTTAAATTSSSVNINQYRTSSGNNCRGRVSIRVVECLDLTKKNGGCDPYIVFTALYSNNRKIIKRTKVRKKTVNPQFDEILYFDLTIENEMTKQETTSNNTYTIHPLDGADLYEISISVWHDTPGMAADKIFLGEVKIPMRGKQQQSSVQSSAWYFLQPRTSQSRTTASVQQRTCATPPGRELSRLSSDNSLGSIRLKLIYAADHVFPLASYDFLMNLLLESCDQRPITTSVVHILGEIVSCKTDVAQPLVRLFTHTQMIAPIIKILADHEISNLTDSTTIFRGNTLVSKMMDETMRLSGLHYLHNTLRPILEQILHEKKPCEIDPARVKDKNVIDTNLLNLQDYVEKVFNAITKSAVKCPAVLCQIFHDLRECAAKHFPLNKEVRYSVVSAFIFLRFFAPAILGPKLFDLTTEPLDPQTNRTLTLISKTIQSLGNLVSSRSSHQPCKEEYTGQLYKKFCTENHLDAAKHFLEVISTTGAADNYYETNVEPVILKEGMMTKRAQGRKRFGRRNFKQRYFKLTTHALSYAKSKGKRPICDIPLSEILGVERVNERSFKMQNIFQIIRKDRPLYVQTTNCVEEKEWVDLLSKICQSNSKRLQNFHPCAFVNGMWNCCSQSDENIEGCTSVSNKPFQMELATALDPARDLQRLHTLIMAHISRLETLLVNEPPPSTTNMAATTNSSHSSTSSNFSTNPTTSTSNVCNNTISAYHNNFEDIIKCQKSVHNLIKVAYSLEAVHRQYKQILARELKYGSRQAPIGDDNYLHMIRSGIVNSIKHTSVVATSHQQSLLNQQQQHHHNNYELSPICYTRNEIIRNSNT